MASIDIVLYTSKTLKNGEHPIMLRIIKDRKTKYSSIGHSCHISLWDKKKNLPKRKHPNAKELELLIEHKKNEAKKILLETDRSEQSFSLDEIKTKITRQKGSHSIFNFLDELIRDMRLIGKIGNSKVYIDLRRVLKAFRKDKELYFDGITTSLLKKLEQYFNERGFNPNTQGVYFRTLRATINKAIQEDLLLKEASPFNSFSMAHLKNETKKRAITKDEIKKIEALKTKSDYKLQRAQDFFMFSYYCSGMNFKDFALLKWENISHSENEYYLYYIRRKTKKGITIKLLPQAISILDRYGDSSMTEEYIFPILDRRAHIKPVSIDNRIQKISRQINSSLKVLATMANVDPNITTYTARHTFATVLKRTGVQTGYISEMMGHKSEAITQVYLDSFENEKLYEVSLKL